jgi:hypothetical protein
MTSLLFSFLLHNNTRKASLLPDPMTQEKPKRCSTRRSPRGASTLTSVAFFVVAIMVMAMLSCTPAVCRAQEMFEVEGAIRRVPADDGSAPQRYHLKKTEFESEEFRTGRTERVEKVCVTRFVNVCVCVCVCVRFVAIVFTHLIPLKNRSFENSSTGCTRWRWTNSSWVR